MDGDVRHPVAVRLFRAALYLCAAAVVATLAATTVGYLGMLAVLSSAVAVLTGDPHLAASALFGAGGVLVFGSLGLATLAAARRVDRRVTAADARPDPVERLERRYVRDDVDEREFERELERTLARRRAGEEVRVDRGERECERY